MSEDKLNPIIKTTKGNLEIKQYEAAFVRLIRERFGIDVHAHQCKELYKTIENACKKFTLMPKEYLEVIKLASDSSPYIEHLITGVTIGETYFFRDKHQMQVIKSDLLPAILNAKRHEGDLSIRVWSAGCSSGEEIYTIAILLHELLADVDSWSLQLLGTDINTTTLQKAMAGRYGKWSMRSTSDRIKRMYFTQDNEKYALVPAIMQHVKFEYLNLHDNTYPSLFNNTYAQDLILCRNVLIYFKDSHITDLMQKLNASLSEGGFLVLGASDPIDTSKTNLTRYLNEPSFFKLATAVPLDAAQPRIEKPCIHQVKNTPTPHKVTESKKDLPPLTSSKQKEEAIIKLLDESRWSDVLDQLTGFDQSIKSAFQYQARAIAYANLGKLDQAIVCCNQCLSLEPTNAQMHFTLSLCYLEKERVPEADAALRKAIFLDSQFVMAHFQLGLLLLRNNKIEAGLRSMRNAVAITSRKDPTERVTGGKGLNYGRLADILKKELELHDGVRRHGSDDKDKTYSTPRI